MILGKDEPSLQSTAHLKEAARIQG